MTIGQMRRSAERFAALSYAPRQAGRVDRDRLLRAHLRGGGGREPRAPRAMNARAAAMAGRFLASAALITKTMVKVCMAPALDPLTALTGVFGMMGAMEGAPARFDRHAPLSAPNLHDIRHGPCSTVAHGHAAEGTLEAALERSSRGWSCCSLALGLGRGAERAGHLRPGRRASDALASDVCSRLSFQRHGTPPRRWATRGPLLAYLRRAGSGSVGQPVRVTGMVMTTRSARAG